jgi:hypothetical protein
MLFKNKKMNNLSYYIWLKKAKEYIEKGGTLPIYSFIEHLLDLTKKEISYLAKSEDYRDIRSNKTQYILENHYNIRFPNINDYMK